MSTPVEQIKSRLDIADVIGGYVRLTKAGSAYKALCPFHSEKSPSFTVSPTRQSYHCFGCNRGGDMFTFIEEIEGLDFPGALKLLADKAGVELKKEDRESATVRSERDRLLQIMEHATQFYQSRLRPQDGPYAYLTGRGLTPASIANFRIGFAPSEPDGWHALSKELQKFKFPDAEIEKAGLSKSTDKGHYDRFRSRIMFPINDIAGNVVAFSGRIFGDAKPDTAKYMNSPETPLYDKSSILFGFDKAKMDIRKQNFAVFVEGQMDLVMAHQAGTTNTVAVSGTALTERHLGLVKRLSENVVFAFDGDSAGIKATGRAFEIALSLEMNVRIAKLPKGVDPADLIRDDVKAWEKAIVESKHIIDFLLDAIMETTMDTLELRKKVEDTVLPYIVMIRSSIEQAHFVLEIARRISIPDSAIWEALGRVKLAKSYALPEKAETPKRIEVPPAVRVKEELIGLLLWHAEGKSDRVNVARAKDELLRITGEPFVHEDISEANRNMMIFRVEQTYQPERVNDKLIDDLLKRYELALLEGKQADYQKELTRAEQLGEKESAEKVLHLFNKVSQEINTLKQQLLAL